MKIKSIAAICKKNKQVVLFNRYSDSGTLSQYIGDGNAVYPISGLPELDEEFSFTLDAAATDKTAKCPLYFTPETDGLKSSWKVAGGVRYFAIPRMGAKSESGFKRHTKRRRPERRLFSLFQRVPIQAISTILYTTKRKFALFVGGFGLRTTTATPPIPRPSPLCW